MTDLLFFCHRIPYPPNKGDKIRAYKFLERLTHTNNVHLACFIDDPDDQQHVAALKEICATVFTVENMGLSRQLKALPAFVKGRALSVGMFADQSMRNWAKKTIIEKKPGAAFIYSSVMAQYVTGQRDPILPFVLDCVDVDSDKWRQYAEKSRRPMRWIYEREAKKLLDFDRGAARQAHSVLFVSDSEAALFRTLAPEAHDKTISIRNGIDHAAFSPLADWENPYTGPGPHLVFTGSMDYWPNVDAVVWFTKEIFPKIVESHPQATFNIVGARPTTAVEQLAVQNQIHVTGAVPKVQPYLKHAHAAVAPLRIARGIQNKVLEAMAMALPTIVTDEALEGIDATDKTEVIVANDCEGFCNAMDVITNKEQAEELGINARDCVVQGYSWNEQLDLLDKAVRGAVESG